MKQIGYFTKKQVEVAQICICRDGCEPARPWVHFIETPLGYKETHLKPHLCT